MCASLDFDSNFFKGLIYRRMKKEILIVLFFLICVAIPLFLSLQENDGHFLYTLDDPYIHLALSKNIVSGHYGINSTENTAPSSSILWPFLLIPFVLFSNGYLAPFILNTVFALLTLYLLHKYFDNNLFTIATIFAFNLVGLLFTGMEHSLQILLVVVVTSGLINYKNSGKTSIVFLAALVIAPLVRYENLAVSIPILGYLFFLGERKKALLFFLLILLLLGAFSTYLVSLGLNPMPASVNAKSVVVGGSGRLSLLISNFVSSMHTFRGMAQFFLLFPLLLAFKLSGFDRASKALALTAIVAILMHFAVGRFGWFHRYGVYMWVFSVMIVFQLFRNFILKHKYIFVSLFVILSANYVYGYRNIPAASTNIYQQQFQMRRFTHEWLNEPVAVNDLGLVAMDYEPYVLDLWGLATPGAIAGASSPAWVDSSALANGVSVALVYRDELPGIEHWKQVARMEISPPLVVCVNGGIDFLVAPWGEEVSVRRLLVDFGNSLPEGINLIIHE